MLPRVRTGLARGDRSYKQEQSESLPIGKKTLLFPMVSPEIFHEGFLIRDNHFSRGNIIFRVNDIVPRRGIFDDAQLLLLRL